MISHFILTNLTRPAHWTFNIRNLAITEADNSIFVFVFIRCNTCNLEEHWKRTERVLFWVAVRNINPKLKSRVCIDNRHCVSSRCRLAVAESELKMLSPTSPLQRGQSALIFSHLSTHSCGRNGNMGTP